MFIGVKLVFHAPHTNQVFFLGGGKPFAWAPEIGTLPSPGVIVGVLVVAVGASLIKLRIDAARAR